jgi:nitrite reductase/ring-hydroxylating ferredoxin subunit
MHATPRWAHVASLSQLTPGKPKLVHAEAHDVVLTRGEEDRVYAIHNVCPHEGYPLVQGSVTGAVLTCAWHNFKFDLRDGRCVLGEEDVRAYPVQVLEGEVWIDIAEPDPQIVQGAQSRALILALREGRVGQALRAIGRGLQAGAAPEQLLTVLAAYDGRVSESGSTHVVAVAADLARLLPGAPGMGDPDPSGSIERPLTLLAQLVDAICTEHGRREARAVPEAVVWDPQTGPAAFHAAVEAENRDAALSLLFGALAAGERRDTLEPLLFELCADHFTDFGHTLIYTEKVFDLLDLGGWAHAEGVLGGLVTMFVEGTREDLLPPWAGWRKRAVELGPRLPSLSGRALRGGPAWWDRVALIHQLLDGKPGEGISTLVSALEEGVPVADLIDALVLAASERLLRFDAALEHDPTIQHGWLDVTHLVTFAHAVRGAQARWDSSRALILLTQAAQFVRMHKPLDLPPERRLRLVAQGGGVAAALDAMRRRQPEEALGYVLGIGGDELALDALERGMVELSLSDHAARPIFAYHQLKLTLAAWEERRALQGDASAMRPVLAAVRFLAAPLSERRLAGRVQDTLALLAGKVPKTLV